MTTKIFLLIGSCLAFFTGNALSSAPLLMPDAGTQRIGSLKEKEEDHYWITIYKMPSLIDLRQSLKIAKKAILSRTHEKDKKAKQYHNSAPFWKNPYTPVQVFQKRDSRSHRILGYKLRYFIFKRRKGPRTKFWVNLYYSETGQFLKAVVMDVSPHFARHRHRRFP